MSKTVALILLAAASWVSAAETQWRSRAFAVWPLKTDFPAQASVVSWSDWLVFYNANSREPGVRALINQMAASGIRSLWWRTFGGGHALYSSRVDGVTHGNYAGQGADFSQFNSLAEAVKFGHKLGLKVYAWYTPLEEAHGWAYNVRSRWPDLHPELAEVDDLGRRMSFPSFYYEKYRRFKLDLAIEMLDCAVDGIVLDFERTGAPGRSNRHGYIPELLADYRRQSGKGGRPAPDDPGFLRFRAGFVGMLVRDIAAEAHKRNREIIIMYPAAKKLTAYCDIDSWRKSGYADRFAVTGSWAYDSITPKLLQTLRQQLGQVPLTIQYAFYGTSDQLSEQVQTLAQAGVEEIVWFETTYLNGRKMYPVPLSLACPSACQLESPPCDFSGGGELAVSGGADWLLQIAGRKIASGRAGEVSRVRIPPLTGKNPLVFNATLPAGAAAAGLGVQGVAIAADGRRQEVTSGADWVSPEGPVATLAVMGVPPFLAPLESEVK